MKNIVEIKDLPILNYQGKTYYALNVAIKYIKQNNPKMEKLTMKKFKKEYETLKLTGCGYWISVELFNELSCKLTKVVVKTLDQTIQSKESGVALGALFFVKDEVTRKAHEQLVAKIPNNAMEEVVKFEDAYEIILTILLRLQKTSIVKGIMLNLICMKLVEVT